MNLLAQELPGQFFDVGIEEEHAVTFSAGLAAGGMRPFCNIYSSFSQRAYDEIIHDVALQHLPVVLCFDRAGLVGEDGATHHGCYDMAAYRSIPGGIISAPRNETELKNLMYTAASTKTGPFIIRYPRGCGEGEDWKNAEVNVLEPGKGERLQDGKVLSIIAAGPEANRAMEAAALVAERTGVTPAVYNIRYIKPLDEELVVKCAAETGAIVTAENHNVTCGLGSAVANCLAKNRPAVQEFVGVQDEFGQVGPQSFLMDEYGLRAANIVAAVRRAIQRK